MKRGVDDPRHEIGSRLLDGQRDIHFEQGAGFEAPMHEEPDAAAGDVLDNAGPAHFRAPDGLAAEGFQVGRVTGPAPTFAATIV